MSRPAGPEVVGRDRRGSWLVTRTVGPAGQFHAKELTAGLGREVWIHEIDRPALVLGSTQAPEIVDRDALARRGVELVRRHSGGGAVLVEPGAITWVDVVLPAGDPLLCRDLGRSFHWLGEAWAEALAGLGVASTVHRGALERSRWSRLVCFAGLGPGEVTVGGAKAVGISQRRRRQGARFQSAAVHRWHPARLIELLALSGAEAAALGAALEEAVTPVPGARGALSAALLDVLARR